VTQCSREHLRFVNELLWEGERIEEDIEEKYGD
jgi:hypothetical protein